MKIILIRPNYSTYYMVPSLGLGYLSSYLEKNGIDTEIIDGVRDGLTNEDIIEKIKEYNPDAIGISCLAGYYPEVVQLSNALRNLQGGGNFKIIVGGVTPTFIPKQTLEDTKADYVICGEGELALTELALNNFDNTNIQGVYSLNDLNNMNLNDKIPMAKIVENLDDLPFPNWEKIQPQKYKKGPMGMIAKNYPIAMIMTSRGCAGRCVFCASPNFYQHRLRYRSAENVVAEIKYLIDNFGIKEIQIMDDNFILNRNHAIKVLELMQKENIKIDWSCPNGIRADSLDKELAELMKKTGCYLCTIGVESANPQILKNIKKNETIEQIEKAINIANEAGITTTGGFIIGLPGDTKETIEETINFAKNSKLNRALFTIMDPLVGSEIYEKNKDKIKPQLDINSFYIPILVPEGLTAEYLLKKQSEALRRFYLRPRILFNMIKLMRPSQLGVIINRLFKFRLIPKKKKK